MIQILYILLVSCFTPVNFVFVIINKIGTFIKNEFTNIYILLIFWTFCWCL